jgi:NCAIR mutase (PurE)-related protein
MKHKGFVDLCFAKLDIEREKRRGLPEIVYAPGKTTSQLKKIIKKFRSHTKTLFISRLNIKHYLELKNSFSALIYFKTAELAFLGKPKSEQKGNCLIITAGTSDINIAEEAAIFLELTGNKVERIYDVGVAGLHRLEPYKNKIRKAKVIIVIAGMEAALLSIVSGLARAPVIGVPTSVGYGAAFKGLTALLAMLNCCSLGTVVVNIDNGLGAGYFAHLINN